MKKDLEARLVALINKHGYQPVRLNVLAAKLDLKAAEFKSFKSLLKDLQRQGRLEIDKKHQIRPVQPHGTVTGIFRKAGGGFGFVRPHPVDGTVGPEVFIPERFVQNAVNGDEVLVRVSKKPHRGGKGPERRDHARARAGHAAVRRHLLRARRPGLVRVDGTVFAHSIFVGDPGAKGARPDDKVVFEMLRFPSPDRRSRRRRHHRNSRAARPTRRRYAVGDSLARSAGRFSRGRAGGSPRRRRPRFDESDLDGREDFTDWLTITIDPVDARDFDDAVSLSIDPKSKHWQLGVHIADVSHFAPPGSALDREARRRGTSVYLPQRVLPMFPEIISNSLASLQQGHVRYVKSAILDLTPQGQKADVRFANAAIKVEQRFSYEQVMAILNQHDAACGLARQEPHKR